MDHQEVRGVIYELISFFLPRKVRIGRHGNSERLPVSVTEILSWGINVANKDPIVSGGRARGSIYRREVDGGATGRGRGGAPLSDYRGGFCCCHK